MGRGKTDEPRTWNWPRILGSGVGLHGMVVLGSQGVQGGMVYYQICMYVCHVIGKNQTTMDLYRCDLVCNVGEISKTRKI